MGKPKRDEPRSGSGSQELVSTSSAKDTPRFSTQPEALPIVVLEKQKAALEANVSDLDPTDSAQAKERLATIHGLTLAGEPSDAIAKRLGLTQGQVLFAQRVLRAQGEMSEQTRLHVQQFAHEGVQLALEGAIEKLKKGDARFIERTLEEGGIWSRKGTNDAVAAPGAVHPGLPTLNVNINMPPGLERPVFGQVVGKPKDDDDGPHPPIQPRKSG